MYIRQGRYSFGSVIYNFDGQYIRQGRYSYGSVIYNIER